MIHTSQLEGGNHSWGRARHKCADKTHFDSCTTRRLAFGIEQHCLRGAIQNRVSMVFVFIASLLSEETGYRHQDHNVVVDLDFVKRTVNAVRASAFLASAPYLCRTCFSICQSCSPLSVFLASQVPGTGQLWAVPTSPQHLGVPILPPAAGWPYPRSNRHNRHKGATAGTYSQHSTPIPQPLSNQKQPTTLGDA